MEGKKITVHIGRIGEDPRFPGEGILCVDIVVDGTPHIRLHKGDDLNLTKEA